MLQYRLAERIIWIRLCNLEQSCLWLDQSSPWGIRRVPPSHNPLPPHPHLSTEICLGKLLFLFMREATSTDDVVRMSTQYYCYLPGQLSEHFCSEVGIYKRKQERSLKQAFLVEILFSFFLLGQDRVLFLFFSWSKACLISFFHKIFLF